MRILAICCALGFLLVATATNALAADDARPVSHETLRAMGLGSAQVLSDHDGYSDASCCNTDL